MSEYVHVGRYTIHDLKFDTRGANGQLVEPDLTPIGSFRAEDGVEITSHAAFQQTPDPLGKWTITLSSVETQNPGVYSVMWSWFLGGIPQLWLTNIEIPQAVSTAYESLPAGARDIVDHVWLRLADLFDSALGGPHLQEYVQTNFGRERVAQLMATAMRRITSTVQFDLSWNLVDDAGYPYEFWSGLLEQATWIEVLKHLHRSYIEQPNPQGVSVARLDRTGYSAGWAEVIRLEQGEFDSMIDVFKIKMSGLGNMSVIVYGGVFPKMTSMVFPARGRRIVMPPRMW